MSTASGTGGPKLHKIYIGISSSDPSTLATPGKRGEALAPTTQYPHETPCSLLKRICINFAIGQWMAPRDAALPSALMRCPPRLQHERKLCAQTVLIFNP
jgi:hypothetical protein